MTSSGVDWPNSSLSRSCLEQLLLVAATRHRGCVGRKARLERNLRVLDILPNLVRKLLCPGFYLVDLDRVACRIGLRHAIA